MKFKALLLALMFIAQPAYAELTEERVREIFHQERRIDEQGKLIASLKKGDVIKLYEGLLYGVKFKVVHNNRWDSPRYEGEYTELPSVCAGTKGKSMFLENEGHVFYKRLCHNPKHHLISLEESE